MESAASVGMSSMPGQTCWVRYAIMGCAMRIWRSRRVGVGDAGSGVDVDDDDDDDDDDGGEWAQQRRVSVSR